jgi:hypothetical protein
MNGFIGRFQTTSLTSSTTKPTIPNLKSGADLAAAVGPDYKMIDMQNIPDSAKAQDPRLLLYVITSDGSYYFHDSYMAYGRADFRMFQPYTDDGGQFPSTCINTSCSTELPKGAAASLYSTQGNTGKSTFTPAPCPAAGCQQTTQPQKNASPRRARIGAERP